MNEKKSLGSKIAGLFVVRPDAPEDDLPTIEPAPRVRDDLDIDASGADPDAQLIEKYSQGTDFDLASVLKAGNVSAEENEQVNRMLEMFAKLPADTPLALKRQIVTASLQAFGVSVDKIIEAALLHMAALKNRVRASEVEKDAELAEKNSLLMGLNRQIEALKQDLRDVGARYGAVAQTCRQHEERIRAIVDFFEPEQVAAVQQNSIRLRA